MLTFLSVWIFCGILSVTVATSRGRKHTAGLLLLLLAGPVGLALELLVKRKPKMHCPFCDEFVETEKSVCTACGLNLAGGNNSEETIVSGQCPRCGKEDVHDAYIENGSWGKWCPNCKMSIKKIRGK